MTELGDLLFSIVCHQLPGRTIMVDGVDIHLCHRCAGLHLGLATAWFASLRVTKIRPRTILVLLVAPLLLFVHWLLEANGIIAHSSTARLLIGLFAGAGLGILFRWYAPWTSLSVVVLAGTLVLVSGLMMVRTSVPAAPHTLITILVTSAVLASILICSTVAVNGAHRLFRQHDPLA